MEKQQRGDADSTPAPVLMDDLVEQVLLRSAPDDPAHLVRAALVCKAWYGIISNRSFRRRFREFHRTAPMLGFLHGTPHGTTPMPASCFVATSSFHPRVPNSWYAIDSRHGRVLLARAPLRNDPLKSRLAVWDPITNDILKLPKLPLDTGTIRISWNATVLCAEDSNCDHLDCLRGPFLVVLASSELLSSRPFVCVYSSLIGVWLDPIYASTSNSWGYTMDLDNADASTLAGNTLYFIFHKTHTSGVLGYDLVTREISCIDLPLIWWRVVLTTAGENGSLGFAGVEDTRLCMYSWEAGPATGRWVRTRVIELETVLPAHACPLNKPSVVESVRGRDIILVRTDEMLFSIDLNSGKVTKLCEGINLCAAVPYMSFCTPALLEAASTEARPLSGRSTSG